MTRFRDAPIRQKLMTMILVTSGVVLVLSCATFIGYELFTYRRAAVQQLGTLAEIFATQSTAAMAFESQRDATEILAALRAERHIQAACLYDRNGRIFARYPAGAPATEFPPHPAAEGFSFADGHLSGFTPVVQNTGSDRFGTLYLRSDMEALRERLRLYAGLALFVILVASAVAYFLSRMLQRQISQPILRLAETAKAISERRDYAVRASHDGKDELGALTAAFNHMLAQIQEQNEGLERRVRERTAELEAANDELEAFGSSAAHDLRTPLRAIAGFAEVLLDPRVKPAEPDAQRYVRMIHEGAGQMSELINALLAFSRLGRQALSRQAADPNQLARDAWAELAPDRGKRAVEWQLHPLPPADGDPALLRVVFVNLLANAIKYTRGREPAVIEVGVTSKPDSYVPVYFVRDNGVGFDMRDSDKLFRVFRRLHHAHEFEGTGVGLATVRRIVDRHGGGIWAEAAPDVGATFYFTLASDQTA